ncbi:hypothetical protein [Jannaschia sp. W003]|uniref:hypothetical protein n=1 Tax=Jannaschia sp. W003 TaxID=2867012 RepID=UPI0021A73F4D|nr:hypothetical protein [Jannaschia sp. W003]UWQ22366.1 hypothetical protein K3554_04840 [Jannaschia sp. W003]
MAVDNTPPRAGNRVSPTDPRPAGTLHEGQPVHDERTAATRADHGTTTTRTTTHETRRGTSPWVWVAVAAAVILLLLLFWPFGAEEAALVPDATPEVVATDPDITVEGTDATVVEGTVAGQEAGDDTVVTTVPVVPVEN